MTAELYHWERRDRVDRNEYGEAAFRFCRASRAQDGVVACRFFWVSPDRIAILREAESPHTFDDAPKPEVAKALFDLADLAVNVGYERWLDPRNGQSAYATAGRI